jgi:MYXO-CTERM domain-containing protein
LFRVRSAFALAATLALLIWSPSADAFCRTTTTKPNAGYDPAVRGCWTDGVPLAWPEGRVPYGIGAAGSKQVSRADATRVANLAFAAWNQTTCDGKPVGITAYDEGTVSVPDGAIGDALAEWAACADSSACDPVAHDVIVFDDDVWPYNDATNTLALTTVTFGTTDGRIFEAYTEVNSAQHKITAAEPPSGQAVDLQAILTHEAGHFFGLAHATDTHSIMYAYYQPGAVTLTPDDVTAICTVYPPQELAPTKSGCACTAGGGDLGMAGLAAGVLVALGIIRRSRPRAR